MEYIFHFAFPIAGLIIGAIVGAALLLRRYTRHPITYNYSLTHYLAQKGIRVSPIAINLPWILRFFGLLTLGAIIARPQWVDVKSKVHKQGVDIALVLDVSGSMQCFDDLQDPRSRFEVAKNEALQFIEKRDDDQIALILFGAIALTRSPLTSDKKIIKDILTNLKLGEINPDGTVLSVATSMAVQRLSNSKAKSKIIVLLTDGEPTPGFDIDPQLAIDLAKKFGIKIYAIGIGGEHGGLLMNPIFNVVQSMGFRLNKELLEKIAGQTGGQFFMAKNPDDIRKAYALIDSLEKTEYEKTIFSRYYEALLPFGILASLLFALEFIITTFIWFVL